MFASDHLTEGHAYSRDDLRQLFDIKDATLNTGILKLSGYQSICLFITEQKMKDRTPFNDNLVEDILDWDGQLKGRTDRLIREHASNGFELLIFYRKHKNAWPHAGFLYEGRFHYVSHTGSRPTHFILHRGGGTVFQAITSQMVSTNGDQLREREEEESREFRPRDQQDTEQALQETREQYTDSNGNTPAQSQPRADTPAKKELKVFYCYARTDQNLREQLEQHLSNLKRLYGFKTWFDRKINPGELWEEAIEEHLNNADLILLLISSDFMASDYCYNKEMQRALERHSNGEARVIPIILRPVHWKNAPFSKLQMLPTDALPVTSWTSFDSAFYDIAVGIESAIEDLLLSRR